MAMGRVIVGKERIPRREGSTGGSSKRVLVILAHPDDPEFFCGGTIARWCEEGREVHYCLLTKGEKGSDDPAIDPTALAARRREEQSAAAQVLGVRSVTFLGYPDGMLSPDLTLRKDIVRQIRRLQPDVVVTCDPTNFFPGYRYINHPDHRAAGHAALDAIFPASGSGQYFQELALEEGLLPHKVREVYVSAAQHPNTTIDVTQYVGQKIEAIRQHESQVGESKDLPERIRKRMRDPESPSDSPRFIERFKRIELR